MNTRKINKRTIITFLIIVTFIMVCFIWYGEMGTNKEVPKKAKYVGNFFLRGDGNR